MRNKGLFLFFSILIAATCLYCLSFSFVTWKIGKDARNFANDPAVIEEVIKQANGDKMLEQHLRDSVISAREIQYLTEKKEEKVFLGNTYKQTKYKELNLGLDLKGGMNVTLEISYPDVIKGLAENTDDSLFIRSFNRANLVYNETGADYVPLFVEAFKAEKQAMNMPNALLRTYFGDRLGSKIGTDAEIITLLKTESDEVIDRTFRILRTRIDRFGVAQPNIQRLQGSRILVELPGIKEPERVTELLKSTAKLEFWEVYNDVINGLSVQQRFETADKQLAQELKAKRNLEQTLDTTTVADSSAIETPPTPENNIGAILAKAIPEARDGIAIAYFKEAHMKEIDLMLPSITRLMGDRNIVFMWGKPDPKFNNSYPLIPLKRNNDRFGPKLSSETIGGARVIRNARQDVNETNQTVVTMSMESAATEEWRKITKAAVDNKTKETYIAIVLDNFVYSYPGIRSEIPNGQIGRAHV